MVEDNGVGANKWSFDLLALLKGLAQILDFTPPARSSSTQRTDKMGPRAAGRKTSSFASNSSSLLNSSK